MATSAGDAAAGRRLELALDLYETGERVMRANLARRHPGASDAELDAMLLQWLADRPGAEHGDAVGRPRALTPRR